jgi:glycosyltransferase involved in cell wall biosynthesis
MHVTWSAPAKLARAKVLWHLRGRPLRGIGALLGRLCADAKMCVSKFTLDNAGLWAKNLEMVYDPFEMPEQVHRLRSQLETELDLPAEARMLVIGYFANFAPRKNPLVFVDAIANLLSHTGSLRIIGVMFGNAEGEWDREIRTHAQMRGVKDQIKIMGFRYPAAGWMAACDCILCPFESEPFGRVLVEAMLVGTPVIASAHGAHGEIIDDNETGFLVPINNAAAYADRVTRLFSDDVLRKRMIGLARKRAHQRFSVGRHVGHVMGTYNRLVRQS